MIVTEPFEINDSTLLASNLVEDDYAEWDGVTGYVTGDKVISIATHKIYEALQDSTNKDPDNAPVDTSDLPYWLDLGATNKWAAFDQVIGNRAISTGDTITYELGDFGKYFTTVAFFDVRASEIQVTVTDDTDGVVYDETIEMVDNSKISNWFEWFFDEITYKREIVFTGMPAYRDASCDVTITNTGSISEVGQVVLGRDRDIGETLWGGTLDYEDYSVRETNDFGETYVVERPISKIVDYVVSYPTSDTNRIFSTLTDLRATLSVWRAGDNIDNLGGTVYGFLKDVSMNVDGPNVSEYSIEVQSIT